MKMKNMKKLLDKITVESVTSQIIDGRDNSQIIAKYIVGIDIWNPLPEWERKKLAFSVHKIILENKLLEK